MPTYAVRLTSREQKQTGNTHKVEQVTWEWVFKQITEDFYIRRITDNARQYLAEGKDVLYRSEKAKGGAILPAMVSETGTKASDLESLTGASMVDFDHVAADRLPQVLQRVKADPHTLLAHVTASGQGVRVLFRYTCPDDEVDYLQAWEWGNEYYARLTGLPYDAATKNVNRLSFLCHDPACHMNLNATAFVVYCTQEEDRVEEVEQTQGDGAQLLAEARKAVERRGLTFAEGGRHDYLLHAAFELRKRRVSRADTVRLLRPLAPRGDQEADSLVDWVYNRTPSKKSAPEKVAAPDQIAAFLTQNHLIRYNEVSDTYELFSPERQQFVDINDRTSNTLWHNCCLQVGKYVRPQDFEKELRSEIVPAYNPFRDYFDRLPVWDGQEHIGTLAGRVHLVTERGDDAARMQDIFERCLTKWLVGMVAGWLSNEAVNHTILVLIGRQGIYKTTFFARLLPPELMRYYWQKSNGGRTGRDDRLAITQKGLVVLDELDSMRDADLNALKSLVTTPIVSERAAYARNREDRYHLASFAATGNRQEFLTDDTGNRRWLPFLVDRIESPFDNPIDYPQFYAQVKHLLDSGFRYWFTPEEDHELDAVREAFVERSREEEMLARFYRKPNDGEVGILLTATEITSRCEAEGRCMLSKAKITAALKQGGFRSKALHGKRGYVVFARSYDEINTTAINEATQVLAEDRRAADPASRQLSLLD